MSLRALVPHALTIALCLTIACLRAETPVPMHLPEFAQHRQEIEARAWLGNDLSTGFGYHIRGKRTSGSDQHFEVDTFVHTGADTTLALNGIANFLTEPGSHVVEGRTWGGGHIGGKVDTLRVFPAHVEVGPEGRIGSLVFFDASTGNQSGHGVIGQKWSFVDRDHASRHVLAGTTEQVDVLSFSNGWSIAVNGDSLELHDARGIVHIFR